MTHLNGLLEVGKFTTGSVNMPAGFQSFLDNGLIQIDGDYDQYNLVKSGYLTNASFTGNVGGSGMFANPFAQIVAPYEDAIIAIRSTTAASRVAVWRTNGPSQINIHKWWNLTTGTIEYYVFTRYRPAGSNFGFQTFNAAGQLTFDANWPLMKIVDVVSIAPGQYPTVGADSFKAYNFSNPTNAKIAACLAVPAIGCISGGGANQLLSTCAWMSGTSTVTVSFVRTLYDDTGPSQSGWFNETNNFIIMLDVTSLPIPFN